MAHYRIEQLIDFDKELFKKLNDWCYDLNGCCAEVHRDMGPFLNEYMYQDALAITLEEHGIEFEKEHYFSVDYHGRRIQHKHYVDFFCKGKCFIECKAVEKLVTEHRQQLWNYMRLTGTRIGILWNFAPPIDRSEHYYLDTDTGTMYMF